jgi:flagellar assembly protein FliH
MFSSRILREGGGRLYTLNPLGELLPQSRQEGFRPLFPGAEEPRETAEPVEAAPPAPPPVILEEEALGMVRQAREEGLKEGRAQAEAEFSAAGQALAEALAGIAALRGRVLHEAEEDLLKLSVLIARKVVLREIACDPGILAGLVRGGLELASDGGEVVARLNPDEFAVVGETRAFQELLRENPRISLKGDPVVGRAGCLLETARGNIEAGVDSQLGEIMRRLLEEKSARRGDHGHD